MRMWASRCPNVRKFPSESAQWQFHLAIAERWTHVGHAGHVVLINIDKPGDLMKSSDKLSDKHHKS